MLHQPDNCRHVADSAAQLLSCTRKGLIRGCLNRMIYLKIFFVYHAGRKSDSADGYLHQDRRSESRNADGPSAAGSNKHACHLDGFVECQFLRSLHR